MDSGGTIAVKHGSLTKEIPIIEEVRKLSKKILDLFEEPDFSITDTYPISKDYLSDGGGLDHLERLQDQKEALLDDAVKFFVFFSEEDRDVVRKFVYKTASNEDMRDMFKFDDPLSCHDCWRKSFIYKMKAQAIKYLDHKREILLDFEHTLIEKHIPTIEQLENFHSTLEKCLHIYTKNIHSPIGYSTTNPPCYEITDGAPLAIQLMNIGLVSVDEGETMISPWPKSFFVGNCDDPSKSNSLIIVNRNSYVYRFEGHPKNEHGGWVTEEIDNLPPGFGKSFETGVKSLSSEVNVDASYKKLLDEFFHSRIDLDFIQVMSSRSLKAAANNIKAYQLATAVGMAEVHRDNLVSITNLQMLDLLYAKNGGKSSVLENYLLKGKDVQIKDEDIEDLKIYHPTAPGGSVGQVGLLHTESGLSSIYGGAIKGDIKLSPSDIPEGFSSSKVIDKDTEIGFIHKKGSDASTEYHTYFYPELHKEEYKISIKEYEESFVRRSESYISYKWFNGFIGLICDKLEDFTSHRMFEHTKSKISSLVSESIGKDISDSLEDVALKEFEGLNCMEHFSPFKNFHRKSIEDYVLSVTVKFLTNGVIKSISSEISNEEISRITSEVISDIPKDEHIFDAASLECLNKCISDKNWVEEEFQVIDTMCGVLLCNQFDYSY